MKKLLFAIFAAAVLISGCDKTETGGPGRLSVKITDDPFDISSVESATVTISKIEIRRKSAGEGEKFIELLMNPVTIDIFELRNGITQELVDLEVPEGDYDLVRLYVDEASLKLKDINDPFNLKVPGGEQTGIKVFISPVIHVEGGISAELLLDLDLSKSFVMRGHNAQNGFIFKPSIRATNISTAGRIEGFVRDNSAERTGIEGVVVVPGNKTVRDFVLTALPVYVSSEIENDAPSVIVMTFSLPLAGIVPDLSAFNATVATVARIVSSVAVSGNTVRLTLSAAVLKGNAVTVAYTKPATKPLQTPDGLQVPSFTSENVTNKVN